MKNLTQLMRQAQEMQTRMAEMQERMAALNAYDYEPDGAESAEWASALRDFQRAKGLAVTGELDLSTQAVLRDVYGG